MKLPGLRWIVVVCILSVALGAVALPPIGAATKNRAGVVVRQSDGTARAMCVFFDEAEITGYELLDRSDFEFQDSGDEFGYERTVCKIGPDGCDTSQGGTCWCDKSKSWNYFERGKDDSTWSHSFEGADRRKVRDGYLDGWSWGANGAAPQPPSVAFSDVCPASATSTSAPRPVPSSGGTNGGGNNLPPPSVASSNVDGSDGRTGTEETERLELEDDTSKEPSTDASPSATDNERKNAQEATDDDETQPVNYVMFGGFGLVFALMAAGLYFMRRRRAQSDT